MKYVYKVWSDNFHGDLLSVDAYEAAMLHMSTADYALHRSRMVRANDISSLADVLCYDSNEDTWFTALIQEIGA
jgi:hypothetical protein